MTYAANPVAIAVRVDAILERLGIHYYVGGSFASSIYGEYRTTSTLCSSTLAPSTASVIFERPDGTLGQAGGGSGRIGTRRRFPSSLPACRRAGAAAR
jgi:hypothetical protein